MAYTIDVLRREHTNMAKLLSLLEAQIAKVEQAQTPDYQLIKSIADYFADFPSCCHHPKEDVIYAKLCERAPEAAQAMGDLEQEHESVTVRLDDLNRAIDNILLEVEVPRDTFCIVARRFIEDERKHMLMEERYFFPRRARCPRGRRLGRHRRTPLAAFRPPFRQYRRRQVPLLAAGTAGMGRAGSLTQHAGFRCFATRYHDNALINVT